VIPARVLVVRSGARSILEFAPPLRIEIVERVSHCIEPVEPAANALGQPVDLAIVTSQVAVAQGLAGASGDALRRALGSARRVAVGEGTAAALRAEGLTPHVVAGGSVASVLAQLPERLAGVRVLLPCGEDASLDLPEALRERGAAVTRCVVYRKRPNRPDADLAVEILERPFAAFCATSPAAARWLFAGSGAEGLARLCATPAVALGPSTGTLLAEQGVARIAVPADARFTSVLRLLETLATSPEGK
jgi:uroporphyrinogen-III synthase